MGSGMGGERYVASCCKGGGVRGCIVDLVKDDVTEG